MDEFHKDMTRQIGALTTTFEAFKGSKLTNLDNLQSNLRLPENCFLRDSSQESLSKKIN